MLFEPINPKYRSVPAHIFTSDNRRHFWPAPPHMHSAVEILAPYSGALRVQHEDKLLNVEAGEIFIASPLEIHTCQPADPLELTEYYCLLFELPHFISTLPPEAAEKLRAVSSGRMRLPDRIGADHPAAAVIREVLGEMLRHHSKNSIAGDCRVSADILRVLVELLDFGLTEAPPRLNSSAEFIRKTAEYITDHYREPITAASASSALSYTEAYFCRRFRHCFGTNFNDYLYRYRIRFAAQRIALETHTPLSEIAARFGFAEYTHFCRVFKKYTGLTPREYRRSKPKG